MANPNYDGALRTEELGWSVFSNAWTISRRHSILELRLLTLRGRQSTRCIARQPSSRRPASKIAALKVGDRAPSFPLFNQDHEEVASAELELLSRGPLVVSFFRGHW
jgi:hypothetical protein